jgi:hypothetical protein
MSLVLYKANTKHILLMFTVVSDRMPPTVSMTYTCLFSIELKLKECTVQQKFTIGICSFIIKLHLCCIPESNNCICVAHFSHTMFIVLHVTLFLHFTYARTGLVSQCYNLSQTTFNLHNYFPHCSLCTTIKASRIM